MHGIDATGTGSAMVEEMQPMGLEGRAAVATSLSCTRCGMLPPPVKTTVHSAALWPQDTPDNAKVHRMLILCQNIGKKMRVCARLSCIHMHIWMGVVTLVLIKTWQC